MNEYFASRVELTDRGCWEWKLSRTRGYGQATMRSRYNRPVGAHRLSYEIHVGPIPVGMTVDHICFNPPCVNPDHLRLLSASDNASNQLRSYRTHCKRGHEYTPETTRLRGERNRRRDCKVCHKERERRRWQAANPNAAFRVIA